MRCSVESGVEAERSSVIGNVVEPLRVKACSVMAENLPVWFSLAGRSHGARKTTYRNRPGRRGMGQPSPKR